MKRILIITSLMLVMGSAEAVKTGEVLMDKMRSSKMKRLTVVIDKPVDEVALLLERAGERCSGTQTLMFLPMVFEVEVRLEQGYGPDDKRWFGLWTASEVNSVLHRPVEISPLGSDRTSVVLYGVKPKHAESNKQKLLDGAYFCKIKK